MSKLAIRMRCVTSQGGSGSSKTTYLESATPIYLFTIITFMYDDDQGEFTWEHPHCKPVLLRKFLKSSIKSGSKNGGFVGNKGVKC